MKRDDDPEYGMVPRGIDELNLAEYPITLLSMRVPAGLSVLEFRDSFIDHSTRRRITRTVTVQGGTKYGLPTALDEATLVGLIQLSSRFNGFADPRVVFTRYRLRQLMGWQDTTQAYRRLTESLWRWASTTIQFDHAWRDKAAEGWTNRTFHVLDNLDISDTSPSQALKDPRRPSSFTWNQTFFESLRSRYTKPLDLAIYFGLESAIARRLYRYLDKHFFYGRETYGLAFLAHERIGLSRVYKVAQLKQKLTPAIRELEAIGFLEPANPGRRFKKFEGEWYAYFKPRGGWPGVTRSGRQGLLFDPRETNSAS